MGGLVILTEDEKDLFYAINLSYCILKRVREGAFFVSKMKQKPYFYLTQGGVTK